MYRRHTLVAGIVLGYALLFSSTAESQVLPSWAQTGGTQSDVSNGIIHSMQADQTVGTLEGRAGVSGGAAVYSIPIAVARAETVCSRRLVLITPPVPAALLPVSAGHYRQVRQ